MTALPAGWVATTLGDLALEVRNGISAKPDQDAGLPVLRISAVRPMKLDASDVRYLPAEFRDADTYALRTDDLLFTRYNGNRELVGACARVHAVSGTLTYPDKLIRVRLHTRAAMPAFIEAAACAQGARDFIDQQLKTSAGQVGVSGADLKRLPLPLAPLAEQQRIADKLDTVTARVDACRDRLARVTPLLKRFRQSVLASATDGRLTADLHGGQCAAWVSVDPDRLGDRCGLDYGFAFKSAEFLSEGTKLLRGDNIEPGRLRWIDAKCYPADRLTDRRHIHLREGDLVLAMDRPIISTGLKLARVKSEDLPAVLVQRVCVFRPRSGLSAGFLHCLLRGPDFISHLGSEQNGSSVPHVSGSQILDFKIRLPPAPEQAEIVRRVDTLFAFADRLEARLAKAQAAADRLTPALLAKAFRGELVPQDPADEPAAVLLQRLAASRPAAGPRRSRSAQTR